MPVSALPPGFNNQQTGDWKNIWPFKYITPSWTAFGPRCTEWWAKWRPYPVLLFGLHSSDPWRLEADDKPEFATSAFKRCEICEPIPNWYISAIQYWTKWSVQVQWPLHVAAHYYLDEVPKYPEHAGERRALFIRIGARRNADGFYDFPSAYVGIHFN